MLRPSAHDDLFSRDRLPPTAEWPSLTFDLPSLVYPDRLNCAEALITGAIERSGGDAPAIITDHRVWSYADLLSAVNRYARVLTEDLGLRTGARVLLRGGNSPEIFAAWLAVLKAGGVAVTTMPLLRAGELAKIIDKTQATLALCDGDLEADLAACRGSSSLERIVCFGGEDRELEMLARGKPANFEAAPTSQDDVSLIAFTSGTAGEPKAAIHFHRDVMTMCHTYAAHILPRCDRPVFSGTPPIAFTFGLGALLVFPLFFGAAVALPAQSTPVALADTIARHRVTHVFTSPTGYRAMLEAAPSADFASLKACVSAGEHLPTSTWDAWFAATGLPLLDGIGATEMMHIFIASTPEAMRPGSVGRAVPGFTATLLDADGRPIDGPGEGRLAVRGAVGCRYLDDVRQRDYVRDGWNVTGDVFRRDEDGYFWYVGRADDLIISSGYNIAGPEVEVALQAHPDVAESAVVGAPDPGRGQIVKAYVVLKAGRSGSAAKARELQDHVKRVIAPYKYPRAVEFVAALPRTATGKIARRALRDAAAAAVINAASTGDRT